MRKCKFCGKELNSKQSKFCSRHCQAVGYRLDWSEEKKAAVKNNISKGAKISHSKEEWKQKQSNSQRITSLKPEIKKKRSDSRRKLFENEEFKNKVVFNLNTKMKVICKQDSYRKTLSNSAKNIGQKIEIKEMRSNNSKTMWKNPEHAKKVFRRRQMSGPEKVFQENYIKIYNLPFYFNGTLSLEGRELTIGRKVPDFVHNTENKLIEIWGNYYHKGQNPQDRINSFKQYNYDCIIIWASELKNQDNIINKVNSLLGAKEE